jgi:hypothetical protein
MSVWRTPCLIAIVVALLATLIPHAHAARSTTLRLETQTLARVLLDELAAAVDACKHVPTITACAHIQRHFTEDVRIASFTGIIEYTLVQQLLAFVVSAAAGLSAPVIAAIVAAIVVAIVVLWCISDNAQCLKTGHFLHSQAIALLKHIQLGQHAGAILTQAQKTISGTWDDLFTAFKKDKNISALRNTASTLIHRSFQKLPPPVHANVTKFCSVIPRKIRSAICTDQSEAKKKIIRYPTNPNREKSIQYINGSAINSSALKHIPDENCLNLLLFGKREEYTDPKHPKHHNSLKLQSVHISPYATLTAAYKWVEPNYVPINETEVNEIGKFMNTVVMVYQLNKNIECTIINDMHTNGHIKHNTIDQKKMRVRLNKRTYLIVLYNIKTRTIFHTHFRSDGRISEDVAFMRYTQYANMQLFPEEKDEPIYSYSNRKNRPEVINHISLTYRYQLPFKYMHHIKEVR